MKVEVLLKVRGVVEVPDVADPTAYLSQTPIDVTKLENSRVVHLATAQWFSADGQGWLAEWREPKGIEF